MGSIGPLIVGKMDVLFVAILGGADVDVHWLLALTLAVALVDEDVIAALLA